MRRGLRPDCHPTVAQFADLVPAHITAGSLVDRIGRDKQAKRNARLLEAWPGIAIYRQKGVIDRNGNGFFGERLSVPNCLYKGREGNNGIPSLPNLDEMRLELLKRDVCAGIIAFAKAMIHQHDGGLRRERGKGGHDRQQSQERKQNFSHRNIRGDVHNGLPTPHGTLRFCDYQQVFGLFIVDMQRFIVFYPNRSARALCYPGIIG